ncbi:hypothetical protein [Tardiphaga sp.]|jgi:hypothetical protein|uniref:hypothetical protein n=1 Tax=Tardiphaga sp. TaxID=1926292 RepID=UPI00198982D4|nr:hypothetical protein [Tardiphaga sp.]MBC7578616.1 hypothetical protein [Tardiphaga sp.]
MIRSIRVNPGFPAQPRPVALPRLTHVVAVSLALASLCLIVALTALSVQTSIAMPLPG